MDHRNAEERQWDPAPSEHFTGRAWFASLSNEGGDRGLNALGVWFEAGTRTGWHTHPEGQTLYVVSGAGRVASRDGSAAVIGPGDVVYAAPGDEHWHGATPGSHMLHLSLTTGGPTEWTGELVTDEDYEGPFG